MKKRYIISSIRAYERHDELRVELTSSKDMKVGDSIVMDGLLWFVEDVLPPKKETRQGDW